MSTLAHNWWALALRGLVAIIFGLVTLFLPGLSLIVLIALFGAYAFVDGIFTIVAALRFADRDQRWPALLFEGILSVLAGIVAFVWPGLTALTLLYLIAFWSIVTGAMELVAAIRLRHEIANEWLLGIAGVLSIVFGVLLVLFPGAGVLSVLWLIGIYALIFGVLFVVLAFRLRQLVEPPRMAPMPGA